MTSGNAAIDTMPAGSRPEGIRESTRAKAREVLALVDGQGWSVAAVSERTGFTEARIRQLLTIARAEQPVDQTSEAPALVPRKKISRRTMLDRAWVTMHIDRRLWAMDRGVRSFWFEVVMTLHQLGDPDGLQIGRYGDGFESRAEFASAHGGTEADLEALFRRSLLVSLANGGIAIPSDLGLRPWGRPPAVSSLVPAATQRSHARGAAKGPIPGQRAFVMGMPGGRTASQAPSTNFDASFEGEHANICADDGEVGANICADDDREIANFGANGGEVFLAGATSTTTEEFESLGGGTGYRATGENLRARENLRSDENLRADPGVSVAEAPAWVTLGTELVETAGIRRTLTVSEAELVRGWLENGATPDILRGVFHTVLSRGNCPLNPALSYFDGAVMDALAAGKRTTVSTPTISLGAKDVPETPEIATAWERDDPENPALVTAWAKIRSQLRSEVGDADYRNWLRPMTLRAKDGDEVEISLPSGFVRDWVRDHHGVRVNALWQAEYPAVRRVNFCVRDPGRGELPTVSAVTAEPETLAPPAASAPCLADRILKDRLIAVFEQSRDRDVPGAFQSPLFDAFRQACCDPVAEKAANEWLDQMEAWHRASPDFEACPAPFPIWMEGRARLRLV